MKKFNSISVLSATLAAFSFVLTSCGGEPELDAAAGQLAPGAAAVLVADPAFTALVGKLAPQTNGAIQAPGVGGVVGFVDDGAGVGGLAVDAGYAGCTTTDGSNVDGADADGIPLSLTQTFNCEGIVDGAASRAMKGTYSVVDNDDTKYGMLGGYKFSYDVRQSGRYFTGREYESVWSGLWESIVTATGVTMNSEYTIKTGENLESPDVATSLAARSKFTTVYTPTDMNQPLAAGSVAMSGYYRVTGVATPQGQTTPRYDFEVSFEISSSNLTYDTCGLKDGSFTFTDGGGNKLTYTYANCVVVKQFNGDTL